MNTIFKVRVWAPIFIGILGCSHSKVNVPFWAKNAGSPAERFELARRSEPELIVFVRRMPKGADLHNHVPGATYGEFIVKAASDSGLNYNLTTRRFTRMLVKPGTIISATDLAGNAKYESNLSEFLDASSMRGWHPNTDNGHDHFFEAFSFRGSGGQSKEAAIGELINRNLYQNVQYLELTFPSVPSGLVQRVKAALTNFDVRHLDAAFERVQPVINDPAAVDEIRKFLDARDNVIQHLLNLKQPVTGNDGEIVIRYTHQLNRLDSIADFFAAVVAANLAVTHDPRVVALNVVAPEDAPAAMENFETQMAILDFLWNKMNKPAYSLHAGELVLRESPVEAMQNRISRSIEIGHARRIGHGISIAWENDVVGLLSKMHEAGILVEICLSSNENILEIKDETHPFLLYRRAGIPVSLSTDDEGVNRSNITMEFVKAIERYDLRYDEVKELARNSIEYSFLPGTSLFVERNYKRMRPEFEGLGSRPWQPRQDQLKLMHENPRLNQQVKLERAFVEFENLLAQGFTSSEK